jgi:hypothetical protein
MEVVQRVGARIPTGLADRVLPPHVGDERSRALLAAAVLPVSDDRIWRVELPAMPKLVRWDVPRPRIGQVVGVVGLPGPVVTGSPSVDAEILFIGERGYPLRADPR